MVDPGSLQRAEATGPPTRAGVSVYIQLREPGLQCAPSHYIWPPVNQTSPQLSLLLSSSPPFAHSFFAVPISRDVGCAALSFMRSTQRHLSGRRARLVGNAGEWRLRSCVDSRTSSACRWPDCISRQQPSRVATLPSVFSRRCTSWLWFGGSAGVRSLVLPRLQCPSRFLCDVACRGCVFAASSYPTLLSPVWCHIHLVHSYT